MRGRRGRPGLVGTMARTAVVAGTASAVVGHSQDKHAAKQAQQAADMQAQVAATQAPPPAAAPAADDLTTQLQKLADLKAAGVLDDAEFAAAKAKLLNS